MFAGSRLGQMPAGCPAPTLQTAQATGLSLLEAGVGIYAKLNHTASMGGEIWHNKRRKKTGIKIKRRQIFNVDPCKKAVLLWS